jgi:ribosomal protein S18 acetylase RimI-like enzyme
MAAIDIRLATRDDVRELVAMVEQYWRFEAIERFDERRIAELLERVIAQPALGRAWLASVDGVPAGYLLAVFVFSLEHQGLTAEIDELFLLPQYRRLGLGGRLLDQAELLFKEHGCTNVFLQVGRNNEAARAFYRGRGYGDRAGFAMVDKML